MPERHMASDNYVNVPVNQANKDIDFYLKSQLPQLGNAQLTKVEQK